MDNLEHLYREEEILKDKNRIEPFLQAISRNKHLFKDKIVLDLEAGLGLLSIYASRSGAKHVYSLKASPFAAEILKQNNIDNVTTYKEGIKNVELPKVDIIISAWMGNLLFYQSSLSDLIFARDKYLSNNGLIFPDKGQLYLQTMEDGKYRDQKIKFWDSVYGVQMKWMKQWVSKEPLLESIKENQLNSDACLIYEMDLHTVTLQDLSFSNTYSVKIKQQDYVTGVIVWMKYEFTATHLPISVTMGPTNSPFWKPIILYLKEEIPVYKGDKITGTFALKFVSEEVLDIKLSAHDGNKSDFVQYFRLN